jgi:SAM-dependent methyltransferase
MHSPLLVKYLPELKAINSALPVLDLACGTGRNGLYCLEQNIPVTFADISNENLSTIRQSLSVGKNTDDKNANDNKITELASFWPVDFEQENSDVLAGKSFSAIMVFRYLHRPLMDSIKAAIAPNGLIIYETFTTEQAELGRPKNPDFLLKKGELARYFSDWEILHSFEGVKTSDITGNKQAVAQIVAKNANKHKS